MFEAGLLSAAEQALITMTKENTANSFKSFLVIGDFDAKSLEMFQNDEI
jgi:hypothetical protein